MLVGETGLDASAKVVGRFMSLAAAVSSSMVATSGMVLDSMVGDVAFTHLSWVSFRLPLAFVVGGWVDGILQ